ncbi:MAG: glycosyltransferase family 2 protein [Opitutaceae bacterium]|nr:glycosyltransferase family 2 protein [Opitutaceae bacterium]
MHTLSPPTGIDAPLELSVVMPCLNEARTLAACIQEALAAMAQAGIRGEVVIADNGSTDGSQSIAQAAGARVIPVAARGYGNALRGGIAAARGRFVVMGDADRSYDFSHLPRFVREIEYMRRHWGPLLDRDPAYNPNLSLDMAGFALAYPPREQSSSALPAS